MKIKDMSILVMINKEWKIEITGRFKIEMNTRFIKNIHQLLFNKLKVKKSVATLKTNMIINLK